MSFEPQLPGTSSVSERIDARRPGQGVLVCVSLGLFLSIAHGTSLNVALPALRGELAASFAGVQWVILAFLLATIAFLPVAGALGDAWGKRRLFVSGLGLFAAGALLGAAAASLAPLVAGRFLQGIGTAFVSGLGLALLAEAFPAGRRGRAIGWASGVSTLAIVLGPAIGGLVVGAASWRWLFWGAALPALALALASRRLLPASEGSSEARTDLAGALALGGGLAALLLASTVLASRGAADPRTLALAAAGLALLGLFVLSLRRSPRPLIDPELLGRGPILAAMAGEAAVFAATHALFFLLPFVLLGDLGWTALAAGLVLTTNPLVQAAVSPLAGNLADRFAPAPVGVAGLVLLALSLSTLAGLEASAGPARVVLALVPLGLGLGLFVPANAAAVVRAAPARRMATATAALALARRVAQAFGVAALAALWSARGGSAADADAAGPGLELFREVVWTLVVLVILGLAVQFVLDTRRRLEVRTEP